MSDLSTSTHRFADRPEIVVVDDGTCVWATYLEDFNAARFDVLEDGCDPIEYADACAMCRELTEADADRLIREIASESGDGADWNWSGDSPEHRAVERLRNGEPMSTDEELIPNPNVEPTATPSREAMTLPATFEPELPSPVGFADRPTFLSLISHDAELDHAIVRFHQPDDADPDNPVRCSVPAVVTVGTNGINAWDSERDYLEGFASRFRSSYTIPGFPADGWRPVAVRSDQTGGMCMVDVVEFANGWCATFTVECICLQPLAVWDDAEQDDYSSIACWI